MLRFVRLGLGGAAFLASSSVSCIAGPCAPEIQAWLIKLNDRLEAAAAEAPSAPESLEALRHHQPTLRSLRSSLVMLGVVSPGSAKIIGMAMRRADQADKAGDLAACEGALARVDRLIGP
jgi:hypothetical protein